MTPLAMLARLEQRLPLLTSGSRDLPDRQQTLRRTLDWSHDLLSNDERTLFRRLSLFAGGFTMEAAQAVADPFGKLSVDPMEGISSLLDKSLLWPSSGDDGEARFMMLQTVRDYALELLAASGEEPAARKAHAAYFVVLAQEGGQSLAGGERPEWLARLTQEHDNIRAALAWLLREKNASWGLQLATSMFYFWERSEHLAEGFRWLTALLALPDAPLEQQLCGRALFEAGVLSSSVGAPERGVELIERSLEIARERNDGWSIAVACNALGVILRDMDEFDRAASSLEESLAQWLDLGDRHNHARSLSNLARVRQMQKDFDTAARLYAEAERSFQALGDDLSAAWAINHQGDIARNRKNWSEAEQRYASALSAFRELGDSWGIATSLVDLGTVARERGRLPAAENLFSRSLDEFAELRHQRGIARVAEAMALVSIDLGDHARALTLAGAASRIRETLTVPLSDEERESLESRLEAAREACGAEIARKAWQYGRRMQTEDLVSFARSAPDEELQ
jgi:tetratricopeptide (TPR) repeat protein